MVPRLRARIHAQRPKRAQTHAAQCFYGRAKSRALGAHKPPPRAGPTMVVARQPRSTGQCSGARRHAIGRSPHDNVNVNVRARRLDASELRSGERRELRMRIKGEQKRESRKHTESLFPEVRGHLITVHVHVQIGRKT